MNLSEPFIRRPIATSLLMVAVLLVGTVAYKQLPVAPLPQVDYPIIVVSTLLPGASAETMASSVTTPLERQFGQMPALTSMTSVSGFGVSQVTLQFDLDRSIDAAEQDVQASINAASNVLPRTLPTPPVYSKSNPADTPILTLAVTSTTMAPRDVDDFADSILAQKISQVAGVGLVTLNGGQKPAVRVQADPAALAAVNLTLEDLRTAIGIANVNQPSGNLDGPRLDYTLWTNGQLMTAADVRPVILAYQNGAPVRIGDVATVSDGVENESLAGWANGQQAVIINVQRQPGANIIDVTDRVKALLPRLRASLPNGVDVTILSDRTETIRASIDDVEFTLVLTIFLVVLVIFAFLRNIRATIIPGVAVPLSLVGTFGVMYALGYSLNNLSLMALTISTGFVVDDAIVVTENVSRFIEAGDPPFEAALKGARQIGFTIVSLTVSLVAVLIPLLFMGGIIGRLFREFAVTLSVAIVVSALLSLTLTPMMCGHLLKHHEPPSDKAPSFLDKVLALPERGFDATVRFYDYTLGFVFKHQIATFLVTLGAVAATVVLAVIIPKGLFPLQDTGLITGSTEAPSDVSFEAMSDRQQQLADVARRDPNVASVAPFIGADGTNLSTNSGRLSIALKTRAQRHSDMATVLARLQSALGQVAGINVWLQPVQDLQIESRVSRTQYQYTLEDPDPAELAVWAPRVMTALQGIPGLQDVASDLPEPGPSLNVTIDRDTASRLGVATQTIDDTLYDAYGQRQVSTIFTQLNLYRIILEVLPQYQQDTAALGQLYVRGNASNAGAQGSNIPLGAIAHFSRAMAPLAVSHQGQFSAVTLSFNLAQGYALGDAVTGIAQAEARIGLPPGVRAEFEGTAQAFQTSLASEPVLILAALITVYIVLGVLYESLIHPVTILSSLPSAGVGAFLALYICHTEFSVIALIGIVLLLGIVKKNAIMMIDFALEAERDEHLSPREAIHKACLLRFRPIMMTTLAALLGGLPMALGTGTGSELRRPLGITIVGGLILSQLFTLYTTPIIYLFMDRFGRWAQRHSPRSQVSETHAPEPAE